MKLSLFKYLILLIPMLGLSNSVNAQKLNDRDYIVQCKYRKDKQRSKSKYRYNRNFYKKKIIKNINRCDLDFDAIYIYKRYSTIYNDTIYSFKRFFETGEVFSSFNYIKEPDSVEINDLSYGSWSMYTIKKNGIIKIEASSNGDMVHWLYYYSRISNTDLETYQFRLGRYLGAKHSICILSFKKDVNFKNSKISWT